MSFSAAPGHVTHEVDERKGLISSVMVCRSAIVVAQRPLQAATKEVLTTGSCEDPFRACGGS
jgi:hypothetical protein